YASVLSTLPLRRPLSATLFPYTTLFRSPPFRKREKANETQARAFRSSHPGPAASLVLDEVERAAQCEDTRHRTSGCGRAPGRVGDRKSTRLNSSHLGISYAVFCLKKKNK